MPNGPVVPSGLEALINGLDAVRRARPAWWLDAVDRDEHAEVRDRHSRHRDQVALGRDAASALRDTDALCRERVAYALVGRAYDAISRHDHLDADLQLSHAETTLGLARVFERLRAIPGGPAAELAAELHQAQDALEPHLDTAFAALIAMAVHRTELRNDLD